MLTALPPRPAGSSVAAVLGASGNGLYVSFAQFIEVRPFPFAEAQGMVLSGEIVDSMAIIAILLAARRRA